MKLLLILLPFVFSLSTMATISLAPSTLNLVKGAEEFCSDGPMKVLGEGDERLLIVGPNISFTLKNGVENSKVADGKCQEVITSLHKDNKFTQTTIISQCSDELKKLEGKVVEELVITDKQVTYTHTEGVKVSVCVYERKMK